MEPQPDRWVDVASDAEVTAERPAVVRLGRRQLAVVRDDQGTLFALDNRCPHEGYPLAQGHLRGCTLTCAWHNFKFDLRDGRCLKGDESVAVYPVRVHEGRVQVDPTEPADDGAIDRGLERLHEGLLERRLGQVARELVRLLERGVEPARLAVEAARFDAIYAEWGSTHVLPVAYDVLPYLSRYEGERAALPLIQAFDMAAENHVRRSPRPLAEPVDPGDDPIDAGRRLRAMVEQEQAQDAEALLRGAIAKGWGRAEIEPWLYGPCSDHFLSFGHPLIYQVKVFDLLEQTGWEHAAVVLLGHLWGIVNATREDTLPRWKSFSRRLEDIEPRLAEWRATVPAQGTVEQMPAAEAEAIWQAVLTGERDEAFDAIVGALDAGHPPPAIADLIAAAAAARLLRFDLRHDIDPAQQEGWLDVTHPMTFADAVHYAVQRYDDPTGLRTLLHATRFVNNAQTLDHDAPSDPAPSEAPASVAEIEHAIVRHDHEAAVAMTARYLADHGLDPALSVMLADLPLRDLYTRPIFVCHVIKLGRVALELASRLRGTPWADLPVLAFVRFAAAPVKERSVGQLVHEAHRLVVDGKVPNTVT